MKKTIFALGIAVMLLIISFQTNWATTSSADLFGLDGLVESTGQDVLLTAVDVPGDGFDPGDNCGYIIGVSDPVTLMGVELIPGDVDFDSAPDNKQGCVGANNAFYEDKIQSSTAMHPTLGVIDLTWSINSANHPVINEYGYWSGYAKLPDLPGYGSSKWLWFDWTCPGCSAVDYEDRVHTDLTTGEISGYAWSDYLFATTGNGYVSFNGLMQELEPLRILATVEILSNDGYLPENVTVDTAPFADAAQYWRAKVQFYDVNSGRYLDNDDIDLTTLGLNETVDSNVWLDQLVNKQDAVVKTAINENVPGCGAAEITEGYCMMTEDDGTPSFNKFFYSASPTDNMLGIDDDADEIIEYATDRDGCKWVYSDLWLNPDDETTRQDCPGDYSGLNPDKFDVFYGRSTERNKLAIDSVEILGLTINSARSYSVEEENVTFDGNAYVWDPVDDVDLSFRPRFQVKQFVNEYDGGVYTDIPEDETTQMKLTVEAKVADPSAEYVGAGGLGVNNRFDITYQLEVDSDPAEDILGNLYLLIDTDEPVDNVADDTQRVENYGSGALTGYYNPSYAMAYGQKEADCAGGGCPAPGNVVSNPTVEQWVCDYIVEADFGLPSCYFTGYLPIPDRHVDPPGGLMVSGAVNVNIDENDIIDPDDDDVSILGAADFITTRNKMYAQTLRNILGQEAGPGTLNASMLPTIDSDITVLSGGDILYANGDVRISGSTSFPSGITLVVIGGDVYIEGNIENSKFGIVVYESGGLGGNVYVDPAVTDIWANIFIDGGFMSYSGALDSDGFPVWSSDTERIETLKNQLLLKGSLVARNTVGGSEVVCDSGGYALGDGTCDDHSKSLERDMQYLRQLRQCYVLDGGGVPTSVIEPCDEGEQLSAFIDPATGMQTYDYSFVVEYDPGWDLPIFSVQNGLFGF